jgi:hypothetical protein
MQEIAALSIEPAERAEVSSQRRAGDAMTGSSGRFWAAAGHGGQSQADLDFQADGLRRKSGRR